MSNINYHIISIGLNKTGKIHKDLPRQNLTKTINASTSLTE